MEKPPMSVPRQAPPEEEKPKAACPRPVCSTCGPTSVVRVSSHDQCARCGRVLESCCEGPG